jgi:hypothetical protein
MVCNCRSFKWNPASTSSVQSRQRGAHKESLMLFEVLLRQVRFSTLWWRLSSDDRMTLAVRYESTGNLQRI